MPDYELKISGGTALEVMAKAAAMGQFFAKESAEVQNLADKLHEAQKNIKGNISTNEQIRELARAVEHLALAVLGGTAANTASLPAQIAAAATTEPDPAPAADPPGPAVGENGPSVAPTEAPNAGDTPIPTPEEVTAKGRKAAMKYGSAAIKPILKEFGVERMSELAKKDRAAFIARLEGLGEKDA